MSFRERLFVDAQKSYHQIMRKRRSTFWGETPLYYRVRRHPKSGEERVGIVKPTINKVWLYSLTLGKKVEIETTPLMLRHIESMGGLDDYLLKTPDSKLKSDVASQLRWQLLQTKKMRELEAASIVQQKAELDAARREAAVKLQQSSSTPSA